MKKERVMKYRQKLIAAILIVNIIFSIFAILPFFFVSPLGTQFDAKFQDVLGEDYWEDIPEKYRNLLKIQGNYYDRRDVSYFRNRDITVTADIKYGNDTYQLFDMYEDEGIEESDKPAIIQVHGGGSTTSAKKNGINMVWACNYFASLGFIAFSVEYTPAPIDPFPKGVEDVRRAIAFIKRNADKYNIDNESIVLMGNSRGGHLVTLAAYTGINEDKWWLENGGNFTASELEVACVVDLYGAVDQFYSFEHNGFLASRNEIIFDGTPDIKEEIYEKHTTKNFVSDKCPPTLIMHGTIDQIVQVGESQGLVEELENKGVKYVYLEVPFGQHGFDAVPGTAGNLLAYYFIPRFILHTLYASKS